MKINNSLILKTNNKRLLGILINEFNLTDLHKIVQTSY